MTSRYCCPKACAQTCKTHHFQTDREFNEVKGKVKLVQRRLNRNSEQQASIESGNYTYQYVWSVLFSNPPIY